MPRIRCCNVVEITDFETIQYTPTNVSTLVRSLTKWIWYGKIVIRNINNLRQCLFTSARARVRAIKMRNFKQWNARRLAKRCSVCTVSFACILCKHRLGEWSKEAKFYLHPNTTTKLCDCALLAILVSFSRPCALFSLHKSVCMSVCVFVCVLMQQIPISKLVFDSSLLLVFLLGRDSVSYSFFLASSQKQKKTLVLTRWASTLNLSSSSSFLHPFVRSLATGSSYQNPNDQCN